MSRTAIGLTIDNLVRDHDTSIQLVEGGIHSLIEAAVDLERVGEAQQIHELQESVKKSIILIHKQNAEKQILLGIKNTLDRQEIVMSTCTCTCPSMLELLFQSNPIPIPIPIPSGICFCLLPIQG